MENEEPTRIDKWLWAVRLFKTRNLATVACRNGQVRIDGQKVKPSRSAAIGDVLVVKKDLMTVEVRVRALPDRRVGAKLVPEYLDDITSQEEIERAQKARRESRLNRVLQKGDGRPTKRKRRDMEGFLDQVRQAHDLEQECD